MKGNQKLRSESLSLQIGETAQEPVEDVLEGASFSMDNITTVILVEVAGIAQDFKESANALLSIFLCLLFHVNRLMYIVQVGKNVID